MNPLLSTAAQLVGITLTCLLGAASSIALPAQDLHAKPQIEPPSSSPTPRPPRPQRTGPAVIINKSLAIRVDIQDGVATTALSQVFHNQGRRAGEAVWVLPLPNGATADHFTMTMNGEQVHGEVLDARRAAAIYTDIVRRQRDPGLLEYVGNGCLRARVFPIRPGEDMRVEVRYRQVLPATAGIHQWCFPLRAARSAGRLPGTTSLDLRIRSKQALKNIYSPVAGVEVLRKGEHEARVTLELTGQSELERDLDVFYGSSDGEFGLNLLTYREPGKPGYFLMMLSPKLAWDSDKALPKDINFIVDTSGSMQGAKIVQARGALKFFLNSLNPIDHFNIIPFSTEARPFFTRMRPANATNIQKALAATAALQARGGTNIHAALISALAAGQPRIHDSGDSIKPLGITVFLTDGRATVGQTQTERILSDVRRHNKQQHRVFVFGVGSDVNTKLLDRIARQSHGARDYVRPNEDIELKTSALFHKLSHPVMSDVHIECAGIEGFDIYPKSTPDLFRGSRLLLTGRFRGDGKHAVRLRGNVDGRSVQFLYQGSFPKQAERHDFIPTLWAQRKVAMLLDNIRLHGAKRELVEEARRLGQEHGIVTRYSSHLITEGKARPPGTEPGSTGGGRYRGPRDRVPSGPTTGGPTTAGPRAPLPGGPRTPTDAPRRTGSAEFFMGATRRRVSTKHASGAIDYSVALRDLASSRKVVSGRNVRRIHGHLFHKLGGLWIDAAFKQGMERKIHKVKAFSEEYFAMIKAYPKLARVFALGQRVIIVIDGNAIEIQ